MVPFFIFNLCNAGAFVFVTDGFPVPSVSVGSGKLGGIGELQDAD